MKLDLRLPIGLMFTIIGILLAGFGLFAGFGLLLASFVRARCLRTALPQGGQRAYKQAKGQYEQACGPEPGDPETR